MENYLEFLRKQISETFSNDELKHMCFALGIEWEELEGGSRSNTIMNLLNYLKRRSQLNRLVEFCKAQRPTLSWENPKTENSVFELLVISASVETEISPPLLYTLVNEIEEHPGGRVVLGKIFGELHKLREQEIAEKEFANYILSLLDQNKLKVSAAKQFLTIIGYDVEKDGTDFILISVKGDGNE